MRSVVAVVAFGVVAVVNAVNVVNINRGCDEGSKDAWLGNGIWKNGDMTKCTDGDTGCCDASTIGNLLAPPAVDGKDAPDAVCPRGNTNFTHCVATATAAGESHTCECDHPIQFNETLEEKQEALFPLANKKWTWLTFTVGYDDLEQMDGVDWTLNIADTDPDINAAFLVGRCLGEVECGKCPPRCATLQSTKRTPQVCALSDYCPGYGKDGEPGNGGWSTAGDAKQAICYNATTGDAQTCTWRSLKKKTLSDDPDCPSTKGTQCKEDVHYYVGVYGMALAVPADYLVMANLTITWNADSAGFATLPSMLALLLVSYLATQQ